MRKVSLPVQLIQILFLFFGPERNAATFWSVRRKIRGLQNCSFTSTLSKTSSWSTCICGPQGTNKAETFGSDHVEKHSFSPWKNSLWELFSMFWLSVYKAHRKVFIIPVFFFHNHKQNSIEDSELDISKP